MPGWQNTYVFVSALRIASLVPARHRNEGAASKTGQDEARFGQEQAAFYKRVWDKYREIAEREPDRVVHIEGNLSIDEVHEQIVEAVSAEVTRAAEAHGLTVNNCDRAPSALHLSLYFPRLKLVVMVNVPVS